ncbi:MAG: 5-aminolevulinate synthase [Alphaproteobacteria bacterium]|nr:5-aminolevulinate synthase [Alphaproteobacteria bacterium]
MDFIKHFRDSLAELKKDGRYRFFQSLSRKAGKFPVATDPNREDGSDVTVWCSNDYLGMGQNPEVIAEMQRVLLECGAGAGGTRNISGTSVYHASLEATLAKWHQKKASLLFTSGYVANFTALSTLSRKIEGLIIYSDAMNHNSMIEGIRANKSGEKRVFSHNDPADLERLIKKDDPERPKLVAWESIYSMDGDFAPNTALLDICEKYGTLSYVDEVHAVGLYGPKGAGVCARDGVMDRVDIIEGTLGKAVGCVGGYIAGDKDMVDFVRSFGVGFIFTTALPPMIAAGAKKSIEVLMKADDHRAAQQIHAMILKERLATYSIPCLYSTSHIVPVFVGNAKKCKAASDMLMRCYGIYVQPINYPTVAVGTERLRLTPSPLHNRKLIERLTGALDDVWRELELPRQLPFDHQVHTPGGGG